MISRVVRPSARRRATYLRVRSSLLMRVNTIRHSAWFAWRLPPGFKRCRSTFPDDARSGATPPHCSSWHPGSDGCSLAFTGDGRSSSATVDGEPLDRALGEPGMLGLTVNEWRITARPLQGWMPQDLGLDREEFVPSGKPIAGGRYVPVRPVKRVWLVLPGGNRPEVLAGAVDTLVDYDGVPLLSCPCGGGVGCAHESVGVSFERARLHWHRRGSDFTFHRSPCERAIQGPLDVAWRSPATHTARRVDRRHADPRRSLLSAPGLPEIWEGLLPTMWRG